MSVVDETELLSAQALQSLPEPYLAVDAATRRIVLANDALARLVGYTREELLTMGPADLLTEGEAIRLNLAYEHLSMGVVSRREWTSRRKDGSQFLINVTSMMIAVDGRLIVHMIVHDLSEEAPGATLRAVLALANDRFAATVEYDETLRAIVALFVPHIADRCTIDLFDDTRSFVRVADMASGAAPAAPTMASDAVQDADIAHFDLRAHGRELGLLTLYRAQPRVWHADDRSLAIALARRAAQAIDTALLWQTAQRELARRAAIHRISRAFAESEPGGDRVMQVLLDEAMASLDGDHGGVAMWDVSTGRLIQVYSNTGRSNGMMVSLDGSLSGAAARTQRPVISNEYQREYGKGTPGGRFGAQAVIAAPLLHEGRLIGVLSVGTRVVGKRFTADDMEALELLAGMAAAMFSTVERAQLQAVSLAARELAHRLNNDLALAVGTIDMLRGEPALTDDLRDLIGGAAEGLERVSEQLQQLQQLVRFQTRETPIGPALDLDGSTDPR